MIEVSSKQFNEELDDYLAKRKDGQKDNENNSMRDKWKSFSEKFKSSDGTFASNVSEEDEFIVEEDVYNDDLDNEKSRKKGRGFFASILSWSRNKMSEEEVFIDESMAEEGDDSIEDEVEDLKETLKILHKWLEKLSPEKINQFKRSEDYERYRNALDRLDLIKK